MFAILVAGAFYFLPDTRVPPGDALLGGVATALGFAAGKHLLGLYIGHAAIGSAYGSASSLALTLIGFFFAAATLLFGAELTQAWGARHGGGVGEQSRAGPPDWHGERGNAYPEQQEACRGWGARRGKGRS